MGVSGMAAIVPAHLRACRWIRERMGVAHDSMKSLLDRQEAHFEWEQNRDPRQVHLAAVVTHECHATIIFDAGLSLRGSFLYVQ